MPHGEIEAARAYGFSTFKMYAALFCLLRCVLRYRRTATKCPDAALYCAGIYCHGAGSAEIARDINAATYQPFTAFGIAACSI